MAYDKIIPVTSRLDHCMDYVQNPEKTDLSVALDYIANEEKTSRVLVDGINCDARTAYAEMQATKRRWANAAVCWVITSSILTHLARLRRSRPMPSAWNLPAACWESDTRRSSQRTLTGNICTVTSFSIP